MVRRRWAFTHFVAIFALLVAVTGHARAYEEQASLDLALGCVGIAATETLPAAGPTLDIGGALGISDFLVLRSAVGYAPLLDGRDTVHTGRARVEAAYLIDVLQWVPFFGLGAGLWGYGRASGFGVRPQGHVLFGIDYLWNRSWTVGVDVRTGGLLQRGEVAWYTEGQLRISRMFELF